MSFNTLIKKSFQTVVENPAMTLLLVLFLIILNFLTTALMMSRALPVAFILLTCLFLLIVAFVSGWFQVFREAVIEKQEKNFYAIFLDGIGKNIVPVFISVIIYVVLFVAAVFAAKFIALKLFGSLDFIIKDIQAFAQDKTAAIEYLNKLPIDKQSAVYGSYFVFLLMMSAFNFLLLFYFPAIFFEENKNIFLKPFTALKNSLVFTFKNFFRVLFLSIAIHVSYFLLALLSAVFAQNFVMSLIILFIYIYFITIAIMIIFNCYAEKNNSNNRADGVGEN